MNLKKSSGWMICVGFLLFLFNCADFPIKGGLTSADLIGLVQKVQPAVVTVVTYDINGAAADLGSGFFMDAKGHLITNYHVLKGAYSAEVKTHDGRKYPIELVVAANEEADIIKVRVSIPEQDLHWVKLTDQEPAIGERILVVGSPLGLEQTVSEGIVSAIRDLPVVGKVFQMSAPISPGSSGSPVVNMKGKVVGVVSFQAVMGQNLNFAVASRGVLNLKHTEKAQSLYFIGLGYSERGRYDAAVQAYQQALKIDPESLPTLYQLGIAFGKLDNVADEIASYTAAIRIDPDYALPHFNMGIIYLKNGDKAAALGEYKILKGLNAEMADMLFDNIYRNP